MADSASTILLQRIQSVGSNVNLWGGYINTNLQTLERASKGYQEYTVTGDATVSWTNYVATNTGSVARLKLIGSPAAASTLTFPAYQNYISVDNACGQTVTIKCSGGTGVSIANGAKALIYCDAVDYYNAAPTLAPTSTQNTASNAYALWGAVQSAIATAALPATAGTVLVNAADTTAGYIGTKITGLGAASVSTTGTPGNGSLVIAVGALGLSDGGTISGAGAAAVNTRYLVDASTAYTITFPAAPAAKDVIKLTKFGLSLITINWNGLKGKGDTTSSPFVPEGDVIFTYSGASRGWIW
jgi:hypothetical protein